MTNKRQISDDVDNSKQQGERWDAHLGERATNCYRKTQCR